MRAVRFLLASVFVLAACRSAPPRPKNPPPAPPSPRPAAVLHGRAHFLERIAPPPGATLDVQLIGESANAPPATLAERRFDGLPGPPYDFDLPYDAAAVDPQARYALRATLRDAGGRLRFFTARKVPVAPGDGARVEFRLVRASP